MFKTLWRNICNLFLHKKEHIITSSINKTITSFKEPSIKLVTLAKLKVFSDVWIITKEGVYEGWIAERTPARLYVVYSMPDMTLRELFVSITPSLSDDCVFILNKEYAISFNKKDIEFLQSKFN